MTYTNMPFSMIAGPSISGGNIGQDGNKSRALIGRPSVGCAKVKVRLIEARRSISFKLPSQF